ncbi:MAG TPA: hypothetical protein VN578_13180 [Candidatus Binatia bacterium]|nr:hypothetical protein [Candidatus Binatia bacterium]
MKANEICPTRQPSTSSASNPSHPRNWAFALMFAAVLVAMPSCSKSNDHTSLAPVEVNGVKVDMPKLQQAFATGDPQAVNCARETTLAFRYKDFVGALAQLDKLVNLPSLTDEQKKVANQVLEQVKTLATQSQPSAGH